MGNDDAKWNEDKYWIEKMMPEEKAAGLRQNRLMYGGLAAIGIVIVQAFLTASMDLPAMIAVVSFAIALPHLGVVVLIEDWPTPEGYPMLGKLPGVAKSLGLSFSIIGVCAAFWHVSWIAGVAVLASGIGAFVAFSAYQNRVMVPQEAQQRIAAAQQEAQQKAEEKAKQMVEEARRRHRHGEKASGTGHDAPNDAGEEPRSLG